MFSWALPEKRAIHHSIGHSIVGFRDGIPFKEHENDRNQISDNADVTLAQICLSSDGDLGSIGELVRLISLHLPICLYMLIYERI